MYNNWPSFTNLDNELNFQGATGPTGPTGPTGDTGPAGPGSALWQPQTEGIAYGFQDIGDQVTSIGYDSLQTLSTEVNPGTVNQMVNLGSENLITLSSLSQVANPNVILGSQILANAAGIGNINGNLISGFEMINSSATTISSNILLTGKRSIFDQYLNGSVQSNIILANDTISDNGALSQNAIIMTNGPVVDTGARCQIYSNRGTIDMSGSSNNIVFNTNSSGYTHSMDVDCCVFNSANNPSVPNASEQFVISYSSIRGNNLVTTIADGVDFQYLAFNNTDGVILPVDGTSSALSRVARFAGSTNASGQVTFNLTSLGLSVLPSVMSNAFQVSTTVCHSTKVTSLSTTSVTISCFQSVNVVLASPSMVPSGANIVIMCLVAY